MLYSIAGGECVGWCAQLLGVYVLDAMDVDFKFWLCVCWMCIQFLVVNVLHVVFKFKSWWCMYWMVYSTIGGECVGSCIQV